MASLSGILESAQSQDKKVSELDTVRDRAERQRRLTGLVISVEKLTSV